MESEYLEERERRLVMEERREKNGRDGLEEMGRKREKFELKGFWKLEFVTNDLQSINSSLVTVGL